MQLTPTEHDALKEFINFGIGRSMGALSQLLETSIQLQALNLKLVNAKELLSEIGGDSHQLLPTVELTFKGSLSGSATLTFSSDSAGKLVAAFMGQAQGDGDLDWLMMGTLTEIGNIVLNGVLGSLNQMLGQQIHFMVPTYSEVSIKNLVALPRSDTAQYFLLAQVHFVIEQFRMGGDITLMLGVDSLDTLLKAVNGLLPPVATLAMDEFEYPEKAFAVLHHVPMGVCLIRRDLIVLFWNESLETWTKISNDDIVGKSLGEYFPHFLDPVYADRLEQIFEGGPPTIFSSQLHTHLFPAWLSTGELQIQHTIVKAVKPEETSQWHAMLVVQDVTELSRQVGEYRSSRDQALTEVQERKRAEAGREALNKQLAASYRQAGMAEVATGVLHNVGNILNSVSVSAGLIRKLAQQSSAEKLQRTAAMLNQHRSDVGEFLTHDPKGRMIPEYLTKLGDHLAHEQGTLVKEAQELITNIEHINQVIQLQQTFAKASRGHQEPVVLHDIMEQALDINIASLHRHGMEVIREYEKIPPIVTDRHQVLQILVNLIGNAKYAVLAREGDPGQLTLKIGWVEGNEDMVHIQVQDNGVGIKPDHLTRIFAQGFTTKKEGHGFGLHSAAISAKNLGGSLIAHSDGEGQGATFTFELPVKQVEASVT